MKPSSIPVFAFLLAVICLSGCGMPRPSPHPTRDQLAWQTAATLRSMNQKILTSKGSGRVCLESYQGVQNLHIAWAAQAPHRVRITFTASGHPVETIAADGERVTFISHTGRHKPHTTASADPDLEPYIQIPIKLSDLISLLLGQIPIQDFHDAWFLPDDPDRILLRRRFHSHVQELTLTPDQSIHALRLLDRAGELRYEIAFHTFDTTDYGTIPRDLTIADGRSRKIRLTITRFRPNIPLKESVYQLTPDKS